MTREVFRRLGLLAASTAYVVALLALAGPLGWWTVGIAAALGPALALVLTVEPERPAPQLPERDFRRDVEARARLAAVDEDEVM